MMETSQLAAKIRGCWLGKNIGGTLGGPFEGRDVPLALTGYDPKPTGVLPNDDLDLQVVWLHHLLTAKPDRVTSDVMAEAWRRHVLFPFDEYGVAHRNERLGVKSEARGSFDNFFSECMGGAIRSEVWACIAPGDPARAAAFARIDASVDHAGEGVYAEMFHAALQAAAFVESDRERLLETALRFIPRGSRLACAIQDTRDWWAEARDWRVVRARIVDRYATGNFTDVVCNLSFEVLGWLDGDGDFGRSICTAVNCGLDTDCTGATLGALLGIIDPTCIPAVWSEPIGESIVLSPPIRDVPTPRDLGELTEWTLRLRAQLKDQVPVATPIARRAPENRPNDFVRLPTLHGTSPSADVLTSETLPDFRAVTERTLHGYWQTLRGGAGASVESIHFTVALPDRADVKLMCFASSPMSAWVDGRRVIATTPTDLRADPFIAPSFHRAGCSAAVLPLQGEPLDVVIACDLSEGVSHDLIFGFADPTTNLWLTDVRYGLAQRAAFATKP